MIRWLTAFLDFPEDDFDRGCVFWEAISNTKPSPRRGEHNEFLTLIPMSGDAYMRVQRVRSAHPKVHLDVHTDQRASLTKRALDFGAVQLVDHGYVVLRSPGGFVFCIVSHHGEQTRPCTVESSRHLPSLVDQLAIDIPHHLFESETTFWESFTGQEGHRTARSEFQVLARQEGMPLRILLHRVELSDEREFVSAHLDIACGDQAQDIAIQHAVLGAEIGTVHENWTTMTDPTGMAYCLTRRNPVTGLLP